jgi:ubiquinone biosynthesis protein UbiJ
VRRPEGDEALARLGRHRLAGEEALGIVGEAIAGERTFLRLGHAVAQRLAHLLRHEPRIVGRLGAQHLRRAAHALGALAEGGAAPGEEGLMDGVDDVADLLRRHLVIGRQRLAIGRIDRLQRHRSYLHLFGYGPVLVAAAASPWRRCRRKLRLSIVAPKMTA